MSGPVAATFVFSDLVDSTVLSSRMSLEEAEVLRQAHFATLRGVVSATGGTEVKNLGDGLMVVFSSPSRALACAVGMQQAIDVHNVRAPVPLSIRVGVSTGEAVEEDDDYFGTPVIEAARLCARADGGQILATDLVRMLVGRNTSFEMVPVGPFELKGLPDPVETVEVAWEPDREANADRLPLPARLVQGATESLFGFFGRAEALAQVEEALKASVTTERVHVLLVAGEPGVGKTTLAAHAARAAHASGVNVTFGSCEDGLAVPYRPWIGAVAHIARHTPEMVDALPEMHRRALAHLVPDVVEDASSAEAGAEAEQFLLFEAVAKLFEGAAADRALMVGLDDLHWADAATVQLLRHLVTSSRPMAMLIVITYRDSDVGRGNPMARLLADLHREQSVTRIAMTGLSDVELIELMAAAAGHDLEEDGIQLAHALRRETDGNPFFVGEILRHLGETGVIFLDERNRYVLRAPLEEVGLPTSVREVVGRRIGRIGEEVERVLTIAAVIGRDFDVDVLASITDSDEDQLLDLLERAVGAAVLTESPTIVGRFRFAHALIQHTLYQELGATRRQRLHQRVGEALEELRSGGDADVPELAYHWLAATRPPDITRAVEYATRAGDLALDALAPDDAARWYRQALDLVERQPSGDDLARCRLLIGLGSARMLVADPVARETILEAGDLAARTGASDLLVAAALASNRGDFSAATPEDAEMIALTQAAIDVVDERDAKSRVRLLAVLTAHTGGRDWQTARERALSAVAAARELGNERLLMQVISSTFAARQQPDGHAEQVVDTAEALEIADRSGNAADRFLSRNNRYFTAMVAADFELCERMYTEMEQLARSADLTFTYARFLLTLNRARHCLVRGDHAGTEQCAGELLAMTTIPEAPTAGGGMLALVAAEQGRADELIDLLTAVMTENPELVVLRSTVSEMNCELGRLDAARAVFDVDKASNFQSATFDMTWLSAMTHYVGCAVPLEDRDAAAVLLDLLTPFSSLMVVTPVDARGSVSRAVGCLEMLLGHDDSAEQHLRHAIEVNTAMHMPYWAGRARLDYAEFLVRRTRPGDAELARDQCRAASDTSTQHGYGALSRRAAELLQQIGV